MVQTTIYARMPHTLPSRMPQMPGTLVFDFPSVAAVTEYLTAQMLKSAAAAAAAAGSSAVVRTISADEEWTGGELAGVGGMPSSAVVAGEWAPRQRHLAVLAVVARPLMAPTASNQVKGVAS